MEELKDYNGNSLINKDASFLEELEKKLGKSIPCIENRDKSLNQANSAQTAQDVQWKQLEQMSMEEMEQYYENYYLSMATPEYKAQMKAQLDNIISTLGENHPTVIQMKQMMELDGDRAKQLAKQMTQQIKQQIQQRKQIKETFSQDSDQVPAMANFGYISMKNRIIGLCLENEEIASLPDSLGALDNLKNLTIIKCHLKTLPSTIGSLGKLQVLQLQQNEIEELPESIGNLQNLKSLSVSWNKIKTLPENIGNLNNLVSLDAQTCAIEKLPSSFGNLSSLKNFNLQWNQLEKLPDSLGGLKSLKEIVLTNNQLIALPPSFGTLTSLEYLNLKENKLERLPDSFCDLLSLKELDCEKNELETLPEKFGQLKNLTKASFENNHLIKIPNSIGTFSNLDSLNLRVNEIISIPNSLCNLSSLKQLDLSFNKITMIPECIGGLTSIQWFLLNSNFIAELPESIGSLTSLNTLWLGNNQLTKLPESLINLKLTTLQLSNNHLSSLPYFIWPMSSLKTLKLDGNPFSPDEKEIALMDAPAILDYCRQRASISVMILYDEEDAESHRIQDLMKFLKMQSEIFGILPDENENLDSTDLILFLATSRSLQSEKSIMIITNAREKGIDIVPLKGLDIGWAEMDVVGLSRELGHEFKPDDFDGFCQGVYNYILQFKRSHDVFKNKKDLILKGMVEDEGTTSFTLFKNEMMRMIHSPQLKEFFENNKSALLIARNQTQNAKIGADGLFLMQVFSLYSALKNSNEGGARYE